MQKAHEVDYKLYGDDMQFVEIGLDYGESIIAEAGAMMYMDSSIEMDSIFGDGSNKDAGKGLILATLKCPGYVWLQSLPFSRMADRIFAASKKAGGESKGEGSLFRKHRTR